MGGVPHSRSDHVPKLPLWDTIRAAYTDYFENFTDVLRISWFWWVVCIVLIGLASSLRWSEVTAFMAANPNPSLSSEELSAKTPMSIATKLISYLADLIVLFSGICIAVAWHRRIILNERPGPSGSNILSKGIWSYIATGIVVCLLAAAPLILFVMTGLIVVIATAPAKPAGSTFVLIMLGFGAALLFGYAIMLRLTLLLPARAASNFGLTIKAAWKRSHGNTWRMFWGVAACSFPALLVELVLLLVIGMIGVTVFKHEVTNGGVILVSSFSTAFLLLITPISIGFLSFAYLHFFGQNVR